MVVRGAIEMSLDRLVNVILRHLPPGCRDIVGSTSPDIVVAAAVGVVVAVEGSDAERDWVGPKDLPRMVEEVVREFEEWECLVLEGYASGG